jgi:general secretion pathway protein K
MATRINTPLADARGSVTAPGSTQTLPSRGREGARSQSSSRGSALLMVLWLTAALSAIGLAVANNVRGETERTATNVDDARAYFIARGAIQQAAMHVIWGKFYRNPDGSPIYQIPGNPSMNLSYPSAEVHVDIIPETSKLGLNGARPEDLLRLLAALGVPDGPATEITEAIVDWRTPVPPTQTSPFDAYYLSLSPSFIPRHASFLENEELLLVKGMTSDLYYGTSLDKSHAGLRDCLSVYGSSGAVDINTAQLPTLEAVGLAPEDAATIVRNRPGHPILDGAELVGIKESLGPSGSRLMIGGQTMFTLRATARMKGPDGKLSDLRRTVGALVKFNFTGGAGSIGFDVLRWFDRA